jgi:hypothetical protein
MVGIAHRFPLQITTLVDTLSAIIGTFASGDKLDTQRGTPDTLADSRASAIGHGQLPNA